jgi:hypothetical protein
VFQTPSINFDVFSEDLNTNGLTAALALDYPGPLAAREDPPVVMDGQTILPGHFDPTSAACVDPCPSPTLRGVEMVLRLPPGITPGCHSATVIVTHEFFPPFTVTPKRSNDLATLTWWLDVQDPNNPSPTNLAACLAAASSAGRVDGGAGASP